MTATAEPSAEVEAPPAGTVLDRAEGLELLGEVHGSGYENGACLVRRADGQMVHLGPLMYALLECVDGARDVTRLTECLTETTGKQFDEEHVLRLAEKLGEQGLLAGTEENAPPKSNPLLALRWKVLVTSPSVTRRLTTPFTVLFRPWVLVPVLLCFLAVCWFVLFHEGLASATSQAIQSPELLLLVFALAIASAGFHELGHASACRYGGATPTGMGMGLYMVWPAFYTDVTDAYRLPRRDRLRTDLGGLYFNAIVAVATMGVWLLWRVDALLLLVAVQLIEMVKQLSPVIRADGYHILADATGVPDLYAHILPTLRRLLPWRTSEPTALRGRARLLVTAWVLIVVPVLLCLVLGAVILFPRLLSTAWESGRGIVSGIPGHAEAGDVVALLTALIRLLALALPVLGTALMSQKLGRSLFSKARRWSSGRPARRTALVAAAAAVACGAAWAWWPSGQYEPIRPYQDGTLIGLGQVVASPIRSAHAPAPPAVRLAPGTHLAIAMIPEDGVTKAHPALFVIPGEGDDPAVALVSDGTPAGADTTTDGTTATTTATAAPAGSGSSTPTGSVRAAAFEFRLPKAPGPGGTQAVAVNTRDGAVIYKVAYSLVTVKDGAPVGNTNSAFAFASCNACTTVAVSFQVVLIIGTSKVIAPANAAGALNVNCPACVTTAIADQIIVTLKKEPSEELTKRLMDALKALDALPKLGADGTPAAVAAQVAAIQKQIDDELEKSGLLANPPKTATTTTPASTTTTQTSTAMTATQPAATTPAPTTSASTSTTQATETSTGPAATTSTPTATTTTAPTTTATSTTTTAP
jgi:putative peptide zinc metalloprotease protein